MSRAYVMPLALVRNIRHLNPNIEVLTENKVLLPSDSQLQFLDPGNSVREVELPDPQYCDGQIFQVQNTSNNIGVLRFYDNDHLNIICETKKAERADLVCAGGFWRSATSGSSLGYRFSTTISSWTPSGSLFVATVTHGLGNQYPNSVQCIDSATQEIVYPTSIKCTGTNTLEVWMPTNTVNLTVIVVG